MQHHCCGRRKSQRRHEDLILCLYPYGFQRQVQGGGPGVEGDRMPAADIPGKILFKLSDLRTGGQPA